MLNFKEGADPAGEAQAFCKQHGLPMEVAKPIRERIERQMEREEEQTKGATPRVEKKGKEGASSLHDRLYGEAKRRMEDMERMRREEEGRIRAQAKATLSNGRSEQGPEVHERLFKWHDRVMREQDAKRQEAKEEEAKKEQEELSKHKVHLSAHASRLQRPPGPVHDRLFEHAQSTKAKETVEEMRKKKEQEELRHCTFAPRICRQSAKMAQAKKNSDPHSALYQEMFDRMQRRKRMEEEALEEAKSASSAPRRAASPEHYRRMSERKLHFWNQMERSGDEIDAIDPETGKTLFHPATGRPPKSPRHSGHVHHYLYSLSAKDRRGRCASAEPAPSRRRNKAKRKKPLTRPQQRKFSQCFDHISGENGRVVLESAKSFDKFHPDLRRDLLDATAAMGSHPLDRASFIDLMEAVISTFQRGPREYLRSESSIFNSPGSTWGRGTAAENNRGQGRGANGADDDDEEGEKGGDIFRGGSESDSEGSLRHLERHLHGVLSPSNDGTQNYHGSFSGPSTPR